MRHRGATDARIAYRGATDAPIEALRMQCIDLLLQGAAATRAPHGLAAAVVLTAVGRRDEEAGERDDESA